MSDTVKELSNSVLDLYHWVYQD